MPKTTAGAPPPFWQFKAKLLRWSVIVTENTTWWLQSMKAFDMMTPVNDDSSQWWQRDCSINSWHTIPISTHDGKLNIAGLCVDRDLTTLKTYIYDNDCNFNSWWSITSVLWVCHNDCWVTYCGWILVNDKSSIWLNYWWSITSVLWVRHNDCWVTYYVWILVNDKSSILQPCHTGSWPRTIQASTQLQKKHQKTMSAWTN